MKPGTPFARTAGRKRRLWVYRTVSHEIHYMMSFIGGGVELISFIYLYKALIGYMTSNMIFGIVAIAGMNMDFQSIYHISIILIWMMLPGLHYLIARRYLGQLSTQWHAYAISLTINCLLLLSFMLLGEYMNRHGLLGSKPEPVVMPLVTIGLVFMYIQNFVIKHGGTPQPTATSVVTTVYVRMMSSLFSFVFDRQRNPRQRVRLYHESRHYLLVIAHFFAGGLITALASHRFGFYSLLPALLVLVLITLRIWLVHIHHHRKLAPSP